MMGDTGQTGHPSGAPGGPRETLLRSTGDLHRFADSYGLVFLLIVATLLASALLADVRWGRLVTAVLMGATLLLTFHASRLPGRPRRGGVAIGIVTVLVVLAVAAAVGDVRFGQFVDMAIAAVFVVAASVAIIRRLRHQTAVSVRTVMGALCVYLFIGLFFAAVYSAVDIADDNAFFAQTDTPDMVDFIYFSFITQATVGYGDLSPLTDLGRMLAITQALLGQVYLVTIVAALVSNLGRTRPSERLVTGSTGDDDAAAGADAPGGAPDIADDGA